MASLLDLDMNLSYYTIPAAFALAMIPHAYGIGLAGKNYDLANPRKTEDHCAKDASLAKPVLRRISRAKAASANGFETLGMYAAGVVAANASGVDRGLANLLALSYLASRVGYVYTYVVLQDNARMAGLRSLLWLGGMAVVCSLYVLAGRAANV